MAARAPCRSGVRRTCLEAVLTAATAAQVETCGSSRITTWRHCWLSATILTGATDGTTARARTPRHRGKDTIVAVPQGTTVRAMEGGALLADLVNHGDRWLAAAGGRGGRGNARFLSNTRRAPSFAEQGERGEQQWLLLELRLMADVALVGFPNSGKSTFISRISAAKPKIGDYPFTTLEPNLGVVRVDDSFEMVVADIPGLIEGASEGAGSGIGSCATSSGRVPRRAHRPRSPRAARPRSRSGSCSTSSAATSPTCSSGPASSSARARTSPTPASSGRARG
jgi:hypothetical protein